MKRLFDLSIASILFISSCALEDPIDPNMDPFAAIVTKGLSEIPITNQFVLPLEQLQIFVPMRTVRDKLGRFVIVNGIDWSINLVS